MFLILYTAPDRSTWVVSWLLLALVLGVGAASAACCAGADADAAGDSSGESSVSAAGPPAVRSSSDVEEAWGDESAAA